MNYAELIAALPLPTPDQTAAFAEHVADAHSWYKHLPVFPPGARFAFFLNPHACEEVEQIGDVYAARPIEVGGYFRHGSRLATAEYRERFGHWDYWVTNPRSRSLPDGPFLYGVGPTGREQLPDDLAWRWSCQLTAFLKYGPMRAAGAGEQTAFDAHAEQFPDDPDVERYRDMPNQGQAFVMTEMAVQRQLVLQTLLRVRDDLIRIRGA